MSGRDFDHGEVNVPLSRRFRGGLDAEIDRNLKRIAAEDRVKAAEERQELLARREAEKARVKFTADDLTGARLIRTDNGWHEVVRVSAKSVTVKTPYSWTDRYPHARVIEFRTH